MSEHNDPGGPRVIGRWLEEIPQGYAMCGVCGRVWDDTTPTGVTPAPSGRCPFEYEHDHP